MSARQIKKLRAQEELARKAALPKDDTGSNCSDSDDDDDDIQAQPPRPRNVFAAFAALEDEGADGNSDDSEEGGSEGEQQPRENTPEPKPKAAASKKKKKKSKKKAKKGADDEGSAATTTSNVVNGKENSKSNSRGGGKGDKQDLDEIDRALAELRLQSEPGSAALATATATATATAAGLSSATGAPQHPIRIELHNLRIVNELRDVFGSEVLTTVQAQAEAAGPANAAARGQRLINVDLETFLRAPPKDRTHSGLLPASAGIAAKRNPFIQWKDTWPRAASGGLSMKQVGAPDAFGVTEYAFVHSPEYIRLEEQFQTMTLLLHSEPNVIFNFLKQFAFHIASLIVVSILARTHDQNPTLAADLTERALFSFGRATLSSFRAALTDAAGGKARLSFRRPENRQFLLAGYHYIRSLMDRGTFRTALEWLKVFLSVMPDDEYGLLLFAQSAAIQAYESAWFVDYMSTFKEAGCDNAAPMLEYVRQSLVPAKLQLKDKDGARAALQDGVKRVPWLYGALFQAHNMDVPRAVWALLPRDDAETLYTELYIDVAKTLWSPAVMDFVKAELSTMAKVDIAAIPATFPATQTIARFVYLSNKPALMGLVVPASLLHTQPNSDFDPLPPKREDNVFSYPSQQRPWSIAEETSSKPQDQQPAIAAAFAAAVAAGGAGAEGARGWLDFLRGIGGGGEIDPEIMEDIDAQLEQLYDGNDLMENPGDSDVDEELEAAEPTTNAVPSAQDEPGEEEHAPRGSMPGAWLD